MYRPTSVLLKSMAAANSSDGSVTDLVILACVQVVRM